MAQKIFETTISLPFSISSYGKVADTSDQSKIWSDRVHSVIGTLIGERVMRPRFGSKIPKNLFDNQEGMEAKLEAEIDKAFTEYLSLLTLTTVNVTFDDVDNVISTEVVYSLPNEDVVTTNIALSSLNGNAPITQETL